MITRVISVFRGQLCSGLCLFICHSRKGSRHTAIAVAGMSATVPAPVIFLFSSAEKMPKQTTNLFI